MKIQKRAIISILLTLAGIILLKDFWINNKSLFVILSIIFFLFFYKIFDYVANFKTLENKSRIDIFFLFIFFVWLFIPMSHIYKCDYSVLENRDRAEFKNLINNNKINYNFGNNFNNWFNDRFCLRDDLVKLQLQTSNVLLKKSQKGYIDGDWLYWDPNTPITCNDENSESLVKLNDFCNKNGIKLYVLIVPNKNDIYFSKKSNRLTPKINNYVQKELLQKEGINNLKIVYPYNEFLKEKDNKLLYFKTEHHWTDDGVFLGYNELMKVVKKDFPSVKIQTEKDYDYFYNNLVRGDFNRKFEIGTTCSILGFSKKTSKKLHKTNYKYYRHKNFNKLNVKTEDINLHKRKEYYYPNGTDLRVILLGTSMSENLSEFIPFSFKHVKRIRNNAVKNIKTKEEFKIMKYYKNEILDYKPDILILCITANNVSSLHNMFIME